MKIARIVSSNSHVDYIGRVVDEYDSKKTPKLGDYGFADFVSAPLENESKVIGVIYNSMLMNPDYANYGPRLSPELELEQFSPDFLNEKGVLLGILFVGAINGSGAISHKVQHWVVPAGQDIHMLDESEIEQFHRGRDDVLEIRYYPQIITHAGLFAIPLLEAIIDGLESFSLADDEIKNLGVLKQTLAWQSTMGGMRL